MIHDLSRPGVIQIGVPFADLDRRRAAPPLGGWRARMAVSPPHHLNTHKEITMELWFTFCSLGRRRRPPRCGPRCVRDPFQCAPSVASRRDRVGTKDGAVRRFHASHPLFQLRLLHYAEPLIAPAECLHSVARHCPPVCVRARPAGGKVILFTGVSKALSFCNRGGGQRGCSETKTDVSPSTSPGNFL